MTPIKLTMETTQAEKKNMDVAYNLADLLWNLGDV